MKEFSLEPHVFQDLNFKMLENDFYFFIDNNVFECNKIVADIISPIIRKQHFNDPTINSFEIDTTEYDLSKIDFSLFNLVLESAQFNSIQIDSSNIDALQFFFNKLGNPSFMEKFNEMTSKITNENAVQQLLLKDKIHIQAKEEIEFIASHLYELENQIQNIPPQYLHEIFSSKNLCISSEEWLLNFIIDCCEKAAKGELSDERAEYANLLECVHFDSLSSDSIDLFFKKTILNDINSATWNLIAQLCMKLKANNGEKSNSKDTSQINSKRYFQKPAPVQKPAPAMPIDIEFFGGNPLNGIFEYLKSHYSNGKNIADSGIINVKPSTVVSGTSVFNLFEHNSNSVYLSKDIPGQWILFDFKNFRVIPKFYSLATHEHPANSHHLRSWVVEVSDDNLNYTEISRESNNVTLNRPNSLVVYKTLKQKKARYIRIRMTGPNWNNNAVLALTKVEFFGTLYP